MTVSLVGASVPGEWLLSEASPTVSQAPVVDVRRRQERPDAKTVRKLRWKYGLKSKYGLDVSDFWNLYCYQKGCCAICWVRLPLEIEHNHYTEEVRGLTCGPCNRAIGLLKDDPERAARIAPYLKGEHGRL